MPESIRESTVSLAGYKRLMEAILDIYEQLIEDDIPAEDRGMSCRTPVLQRLICPSTTMRCWTCARTPLFKGAVGNRELMECLKAEVEKVSPKLAGYLRPKCYWLGRCPEAKSCWEYKYK